MNLSNVYKVLGTRLGISVLGAVLVLLIGISFQKIILPNCFPERHWGAGLLRGWDTVYFHEQALAALEMGLKVKRSPELHHSNLFVSELMAFIYFFTVPQPWVLIFLNALIHGGALYFLWEIFRSFTDRKAYLFWAVVPYAVFPTTWTWNLQFLKDGISNFALILFLCGFLGLVRETRQERFWTQIRNRILLFLGVLITTFIRSYLSQILVLLLVFGLCCRWFCHKRFLSSENLAAGILGNILIGVTIYSGTQWVEKSLKEPFMIVKYEGETPVPIQIVWKDSTILPTFLESKFKAISRAREGGVRFGLGKTYGFNTKSITSSAEFVKALPGSILGALVLPSPRQILRHDTQGGDLPVWLRASLLLEMGSAYILFPLAIFFLLVTRARVESLLLVGFVLSFLGIYSMVNVNVGTLHRQVFLQLCLLDGVGLICFSVLRERYRSSKKAINSFIA